MRTALLCRFVCNICVCFDAGIAASQPAYGYHCRPIFVRVDIIFDYFHYRIRCFLFSRYIYCQASYFDYHVDIWHLKCAYTRATTPFHAFPLTSSLPIYNRLDVSHVEGYFVHHTHYSLRRHISEYICAARQIATR